MPKDWNAAYANNETPWDSGYASPPLRAFLKPYSLQGRVLVPGCGSGHDVRLLAGQGGLAVLGLDLAPLAIKKAQSFTAVGDECYAQANFLNLPKNYCGQFDAVVEHTCLCAIDPADRETYVQSVLQALKPDGTYLAVFFREVPNYRGGGPPYPISADEIDTLFAERFEILERIIPQETYPSRPVGCEEVCLMRVK